MLWGECISGALYTGDFQSMAKSVGFDDPRVLSSAPIEIHDESMKQLLGPTKFYSTTARLFKLPGMLEPACEDYGQVAIYKVHTEAHRTMWHLVFVRSLKYDCGILLAQADGRALY